MSCITRIAALAAVMTAFAAASANAATTIGQVPADASTLHACGFGPYTTWQIQYASGAPGAGAGGVITSVRTFQPAASAGQHLRLQVLSLDNTTFSPEGQATVRATSDPLTVAGADGVEQFATRLPIAAGQGIGFSTTEAVSCYFDTPDDGDRILFNGNGEPAPGTVLHAEDGSSSVRVNLEATIEPDADGDGFGDETQDTCASDPGTHDGACQADASITATAVPTTIGVGDVAVLSGTVANAGNASAAAAVLHVTAPPGLQVVSSIPATGCAFAADLACTIGTLSKGSSVPFIVVLKGTSTGAKALGASVTSPTIDPNAANNAVSTPIKVERQVPLVCTVPTLKGLTRSQAKRLLAALHCKLGKAKRKTLRTGRRGTVRKQSRKAGTVLPAGSTINVTLRK